MMRTFRAGRSYDLVVFDRLPEAEQLALAELKDDPDLYGVLMPHAGSGRTIKALGRDTALLWFTMQTPGALPAFAWAREPAAMLSRISAWLLDGVLEVEHDGRFVCGAEAASLLNRGRETAGTVGKLEMMAHAALRYAESLWLDNPQELAGRLYGFGRQPLTPGWANRLPARDAVKNFVAGDEGSPTRRKLDSEWIEAGADKARGWIVWSNPARSKGMRSGEATYKLYVSPDIEAMPAAFSAVLEVASEGVRSFKIGADAAGLLRPDKLVLYFSNQEDLFRTASRLAAMLREIKPHGVPFSAAITSNGLLSWGMDPPDGGQVLSWQEPESWRLWVVRRLAAAMVAAQSEVNDTMSPADFALTRLRHQGVDVERWTPSISLWRKP